MNYLPLTTEKLTAAAVRADKLGNHYGGRVLRDMARNLERWGDLSHRQNQYCLKLLHENSEEKLKKGEGFYEELFADATLLVEAEAVCEYYTREKYNRYRQTARAFLLHLKHGGEEGCELPPVSDFLRIFENKYAEKVRESARNPLRYNVGDLVMIRKGSWGDLESPLDTAADKAAYPTSWGLRKHYRLSDTHGDNNKPHLWELPCMVLAADHRPITKSLSYSDSRGGCRWLKVLPLGHAHAIDVMERDLKKCQKKKVS